MSGIRYPFCLLNVSEFAGVINGKFLELLRISGGPQHREFTSLLGQGAVFGVAVSDDMEFGAEFTVN